jgi:hypothetical protein
VISKFSLLPLLVLLLPSGVRAEYRLTEALERPPSLALLSLPVQQSKATQKTEAAATVEALARVAGVYATVGLGTTPNITQYNAATAGLPDYSHMITGLPIGVGASYRMSPEIEFGASFTSMVSALPVSSMSQETERLQMILAHLDFHPLENLRTFYSGVLFGALLHRGLLAGQDAGDRAKYFIGGARVGFDFDLIPHFTLGPEVRVALSSGGIERSFFSANAVLRYYF